MKIKKANAVVALVLIALLILHLAYEVWSYLRFYYNPVLTAWIGYGFVAATGLHVVLSIVSLVRGHDGSRLSVYPKENRRTIVQRLSAVCILALLFFHIKTGDWIAGHVGGFPLFVVLIILQLLFWLMVFLHIATSFSRALITLGLLSGRRAQRAVDVAVSILCAAAAVIAAMIVIRTQLFLFSM